MSKELVVSSSRHETRVAVLEDDQLVEIYFQREREYSLAGSIHKGRVTRVLPGMQSAFVDIGLERDAFLYVSDFFEDNEEYDAVVSTVEDKVLRMEKGEKGAPKVIVPAIAEPVEPIAAPAAPVAAAPAAAPAQAAERERPDRGDRDRADRDRRGRRSRRRRGRPRGLPESKFSTPEGEAPAAVEAHEPEMDDDVLVLPGESLAKYAGKRGDEEGEFGPEMAEDEAGSLLADASEESAEESGALDENFADADFNGTSAIASVRELTADSDLAPETEEDRESESVAEAIEQAVEALQEEHRTAALADTSDEIAAEPVEQEAEEASELEAEASDAVQESEDEQESETEPEEDAAPEAEGEAEVEVMAADEAAAPSETAEPGAASDEVEPARIPQSLTATLREQGGRYMHRVSRRMRRKMRAGGSGEQQEQTEAPAERRPEPRSEASRSEQQAARAPKTAPRPQASISELLREGQEIIVQIAKEPLGQKGARITSYVALPGRFVVYMPTVDHIGVSRKISSDEERQRLKRILQGNRQGIPGGFILRTAGEGQTEEDLRADMMFLYNMWLDIRQKAEKRKAPALVHHDLDVVQRVLRDQFTSSFKSIWVDNEEVYERVVQFVQRFQPQLVSRVKLYTRSSPIFDAFNITSELEKALRPKVWLKSGGYIVINQTEALVAIDVNTGKFVGKSNRLEDTIVKTNTDAIKEIVRQIRLRDLGGIIVVDFIDMDERKNRQKVMQALEESMRADRAPYKILQFNDFGLVAITRKRVKQSLERTLCSPCPYCEGAGYVKSVPTIITEIMTEAQKIAKAVDTDGVVLRVNPEVARILKSNKNDYLGEIEEILGRSVLVKSDAQIHQEKFDLA